jgi:hypothetical protein
MEDAAPTADAPAIQAPGTKLVGWWKFDDGSGAVAVDSSGQKNDGEVMGLTSSAWVTGKHGGALSFPAGGRTGAVKIPLSPSLRALRQITVAAWINRVATSTELQPCVASQQDDIDLSGETFNLQAVREDLQAYVMTSKAAQSTGTGPFGILAPGKGSRQTWMHVAMTYDGATLRLFRDGAIITSVAITRPFLPSNQPFYLGVNRNGTDGTYVQPFEGLLDDIVIYSSALSPASIAALAEGAEPSTF